MATVDIMNLAACVEDARIAALDADPGPLTTLSISTCYEDVFKPPNRELRNSS